MGQTQSKVSPQKPSPSGRMEYLDNFRIFLTALVIYHHMAIPYGGIGSWFHTSNALPNTNLSLMSFNVVNQTYFMGSFFFLSGYFSAKAWKRKGTVAFLKMKLMKLGVPVVFYTLLAGPIQIAMFKLHNGENLGIEILTRHWKSLRGIRGPVWYCALVLLFDTIYTSLPTLPDISKLGFLPPFILNIATSFLIRIPYPVGTAFTPLNLQPAYLPQYISSYALGTSLQTPTPPPLTATTRNILISGSLASTASILGLLHYYPGSYPNPITSLAGGPNLLALSYAVWNETTGYLLGSSILSLFKQSAWLNRPWGRVAESSYAAFLVHPVVCVGLQVWGDGWQGGGVLKTALVGSLAVIGSWKCGQVMVSSPGLRKFL